MSRTHDVLVVDDDPVTLDLLREVLADEGHRVSVASSGNMALDIFRRQPFDVVLTDVRMPGMTGLEFLRQARPEAPGTVFVVMTAFGSIETAFEAIREGAYDYLSKPFRMEDVRLVVRRALDQKRLEAENAELRAELATQSGLEQMVGRSPAMQELFKSIARLASSRSTVLLQGESGTGKELVARALHIHGDRREHSFVPVNCGAIPEALMESELFGHVKGAFTGAVATRIGLVEEADGGTLFLDEVGELSLALQAKLLRVLQEQEIKKVGANETQRVDVRVIAATHRDLKSEVAAGRFREDLYYRLGVVTLRLPALRERPGDLPFLARHFLEKARRSLPNCRVEGFAPETVRLLADYDWPGNVRELENAVERALALTSNRYLVPEDFAPSLGVPSRPAGMSGDGEDFLTLRELERRHILRALERFQGNKTQAADALGISRRTLIRIAQRLGFDAGSDEPPA